MSEITAKDVIDWQNAMRSQKGKTGKPVSPTYLKTIHGQLSDYSGSPAHPGRSSAQPDRASAHLIRSAVQLMPVADQHTC